MAKSHSRPYTSNDNPFSEAQFKTLKYRPDYPQRFESIEHARFWSRHFVDWYNHQHRHGCLGLMTPPTVHAGLADQVSTQRQQVLQAAYEKYPQRSASLRLCVIGKALVLKVPFFQVQQKFGQSVQSGYTLE